MPSNHRSVVNSRRPALLAALGLACWLGQARPAGAGRAALVGAGGERAAQVLALAEAKLAEARDLQLVERREIDRALGEQKLSLGGLVKAEAAVGAGKLLSVELFAVLDAEEPTAGLSGPRERPAVTPAGKSLAAGAPAPGASVGGEAAAGAGLVVFDAATGVRLWDAALDLRRAEEAADAVAAAVLAAEWKRRRGAADVRPLCVTPARNADLPHDLDGVCDAVGPLLERDLLASASLAVLERSRLDQVNRESALAGAAPGDAFLASVVVVDLEVARGGGGDRKEGRREEGPGLRATAVLRDVKGGPLGKAEFEAPSADAAALAAGLAGAVAGRLGAADAAAPAGVAQGVGLARVGRANRAAEAARFARESLLLSAHRDFVRALGPAEAAAALAGDDLVFQALLARARVAHGEALYHAAWFGSDGTPTRGRATRERFGVVPPTLLRGVEALPDLVHRCADAAPADREAARAHLARAEEDLITFLTTVGLQQVQGAPAAPPSPADLADLAAVRAALRRYALGALGAEALAPARARHDPAAFSAYTKRLAGLLDDDAWVYARDGAEWSQDLSDLVGEWLDLLHEYGDEKALSPVPMGTVFDRTPLACAAIRWTRQTHRGLPMYPRMEPQRFGHWPLSDADRARVAALAARLEAHRSPRVALYGPLCRLSLDVERDQASAEKVKADVGAYLAEMERRLDGYVVPPGGDTPPLPPAPVVRRPPNAVGGRVATDDRLFYYTLMVDADELLDQTPYPRAYAEQILDVMLSRKEMASRVAWPAVTGASGVPLRVPGNSDAGANAGASAGRESEAEIDRRIRVAARITAVLNDPDCRILEGDRERMKREFRPDREHLRHPADPEPEPSTVPWADSVQLIDTAGTEVGLRSIDFPIAVPAGTGAAREGAVVYAAGISYDRKDSPGDEVRLMRFVLDGPAPAAPAVAGALSTQFRQGFTNATLSAACLHHGWYAAGTQQKGIFLFPIDAPADAGAEKAAGVAGAAEAAEIRPRHLYTASHLPSMRVTALAGLGGKIYAGLGRAGQDGFLVSYDLADGAIEVLASSTRKDKQSPFDDGTPFTIRHLAADPDRNRLIVAVQREESALQVNGLWEFVAVQAVDRARHEAGDGAGDGADGGDKVGDKAADPAGRWRQLLPMRLGPPDFRLPQGGLYDFFWASQTPSGGDSRPPQLWYAVTLNLFVFDLKADRAEIISRWGDPSREPCLPKDTSWYRPDTLAARSANGAAPRTMGAYAVLGDWLWTGKPWCRVSLKDGRQEKLSPLRPSGAGGPDDFRDSDAMRGRGEYFWPNYLTPLPDGKRLLVGDGRALWVLTPRE